VAGLFLTAGSDYYLHSLRLLGFCGVAGINWAVVTRMRERAESANEYYFASLPQDACSVLHYMCPQFRFLIYMGRDDKRVNLDARETVFFDDAEKVVSGDASVWGSPVVVDGVPLLPDVECLVPPWLQQEFFVRTSGLSVSEGHHYVYPGVRGPLLLPSDYIRKYIFFNSEVSCSILNLVLLVVFLILIFITAVTPVLSDQRGAVLRQGGHVLSRCFRYYVPDFSGTVVVQTPIIVR
jgi:hypothetical protein